MSIRPAAWLYWRNSNRLSSLLWFDLFVCLVFFVQYTRFSSSRYNSCGCKKQWKYERNYPHLVLSDSPLMERSFAVISRANLFFVADLELQGGIKLGSFSTYRWAAPSPTPTVLSFDPVEKAVYWICESTNTVFRTTLLDSATTSITDSKEYSA